jgi:anti-anti-sigma factor
MSLEYRVERQGDVTTVAPIGDVSLETVEAMREVLRSAVATHESGRIDVDMQAVTFLDSSGIGVLVAAQRAAAARGTSLMLCNPGPLVRMVLEVSHLDKTLVREPTDA